MGHGSPSVTHRYSQIFLWLCVRSSSMLAAGEFEHLEKVVGAVVKPPQSCLFITSFNFRVPNLSRRDKVKVGRHFSACIGYISPKSC